MWGDGEEPQSSAPLLSTDNIWSCSVQFIKTTLFFLTFRSNPTKNWGPIRERVEKWTSDLLTRTAVNLLAVLLNQVGSSASVLEFKDSSASGFQDKSSIINFCSKDHKRKLLFFQFPRHQNTAQLKKDKLTSAAPDLRVTSLVIVYGFGWSADHTNCWGVPSPINCV